MDNQNKEEESDCTEFCELQISELLEALAESRSTPCDSTGVDPPKISTGLSILKNTGTGTPDTHGSFRSRAVLPEDISRLSKCQFKRQDHLSEICLAPITTVASSQEGQVQPSLPSSNPIVLAHLVGRYKMLQSDSTPPTGELPEKHEVYPHLLGVQAWTKQQSCEPLWMLPKHFPQTGPTNEWFFEDLTDLQRKLFLGASKKPGALGNSRKTTHRNQSDSTSLPPS